MGTQTTSSIATKSVHRGTQFRFLNLLLTLNLTINACNCRPWADESQTRSSHRNYFKFQIENNERKSAEEHADKCSLAIAGSKQLEHGVQLPLVHIHGSCSPLRPVNSSWESMLSQILERDRFRVQALTSRIVGNISRSDVTVNIPVNTGVNYNTGNYLTWVAFGTPKVYYVTIIDSGSDITWIRCKPCGPCNATRSAVFDPKKSSTFKVIRCISDTCNLMRNSTAIERSCIFGGDCQYTISYGDGSKTFGQLSTEVLTVAADSVNGFVFGCSHDNNEGFGRVSGLLALGRSPLSFPAQTRTVYGGLFSYCLPDHGAAGALGSLTFGQAAIPPTAIYTELLDDPRLPAHYFVGLSSISVGGQPVSLPSDAFDGTRTIIDSGTTVTRFQQNIYEAFKDLFLQKANDTPRANGYTVLDTCYNVSAGSRPYFPSVTLHFEDGTDFNLHGKRVMVPVNADSTQMCLAFRGSPSHLNIIGSLQQQDYRVSFDIPNKRVAFTPEACGTM